MEVRALITTSNKLFLNIQSTGFASIYDLQMAIFAALIPSTFLLFYSTFGQMFHSNLAGLSDTVYQTEWHRYPRRLQYFVLFAMKRSQKSFFLSAFGLMALNLENYLGVSVCEKVLITVFVSSNFTFQLLRWIYSAFMLLRSFE